MIADEIKELLKKHALGRALTEDERETLRAYKEGNQQSALETLLCDVGKLADFCDLTVQRVQQLANSGVMIKTQRGQYDLHASAQAYIRYQHKQRTSATGEDGDFEKHRSRLYAARADKAEEEAKLLKGKSHDAETIADVINAMLANFLSRCLAIPTQAAPLVANSNDPNACKGILTDAIYQALEELAAYPAQEIHSRQLKRKLSAQIPDDIDDDPAV